MSDDSKKYFAHETACIDDGAVIGEGTKIWHFSHVMGGARLGRDCSLGQNVVVHSTAIVGDGVKIQNNVSLYDGVILEDYVFCGPSMVFTNVVNPRSHTPRKDEYKQTLVKQGTTIGANATVVCGNTIGVHAFVGAASLVTRDVPDHALVFGVPARLQGWMCTCGVRLELGIDPEGAEETVCAACGRSFSRKGRVVRKQPTREAGE
ncbi:MAG: N-acetyltransferase [Candidatus Glassbacteria bacterium]|nr:N-acetyltransferase [Candidatus Glassbacteria bacterium]